MAKGMDDKIKDRIKKIRKDHNLSQEEYGKRIGITKSSVSLLESGKNKPSDQTIDLICREFFINEEYLRYGRGNISKKLSGDDEFMRAATEIAFKGDEYAMKAVIEYWKLKDENKKLIWEFLSRIIDNGKE